MDTMWHVHGDKDGGGEGAGHRRRERRRARARCPVAPLAMSAPLRRSAPREARERSRHGGSNLIACLLARISQVQD